MVAEAAVFAGDHGERQVAGYALERHKAIFERRAPDFLRHHHRGDWRVHEAEGDDGEEQAHHDGEDHEPEAPRPRMPPLCPTLCHAEGLVPSGCREEQRGIRVLRRKLLRLKFPAC